MKRTQRSPKRPLQLLLAAVAGMLLVSCIPIPGAAPTSPFRAPFAIPAGGAGAAPATPAEIPTGTSTTSPPDIPSPTLEPRIEISPVVSTPELPPPASGTRPSYVLYATVDYDNHHVAVDQAITYPNQTGISLGELVLAVEPMLYANAFSLSSLSVNGIDNTGYSLVSHRLSVPLSQPLPPGGQVTLVLEYDLNIPIKQKTNTFGWLSSQTNLTDWYPFVVPYDPSAGWLLHDFMPYGEHLVYDAADFEVNLRFADPASAPMVAAPALPEVNGEWTRYRLGAARTFALSMSRDFLLSESAVGSVVVRSYYFAGHEDAGVKMMSVGTQVIGLFEPVFAPYPYPVINVVELEYNDGQEYDGLCFLSSNFYDTYDGGSKNNLVTIGVHEMAHNWWFGLVGNDQAFEPWLDEAMALYSERIFYEYTNPGLVDWWWQFRVNYFGPNGWVDSSIYNNVSFRDYTNSVYLNGATFIEDVRMRIGDQAFYAFLQDYAAQMSHRRATTADFFAILRSHTPKDISDLISAYFSTSY